MTIFIDCLIGQEYEKLILEGNATQKELTECFEDLYMQYVECAGGKQAVKKVTDTAMLAMMQTRLQMFELLIKQLEITPTEKIFELLYSFPTYMPIKLDYSEENVVKVINSMIPYWKSETIDYMNEMDAMKLKNPEGEGGHYTYEYFTSMMVEMESAINMKPDDNMTVGKFCIWLNKYKAYVKQMELQQLKSKR